MTSPSVTGLPRDVISPDANRPAADDVSTGRLAIAAVGRTRWSWLDVVLLGIVLAFAAQIRFSHIDAMPSFDELWHMATTKAYGNALAYFQHNVVYLNPIHLTSLEDAKPFWHIWSGMQGVLHPPLFIIALRFWRDVMGDSELAAHGFSIACSLISIACCYATARLAMDRVIATILALALAVAQTQVYVAQEVRPYAMLCALGSFAVWQMTCVQVLGPTRRRAITLGLLTLPMQLTHYFAFGGAGAIVVFGLLCLGPWRKWFVASVVAAILIFVFAWGPFAVEQIQWLGTGDVFLKVHPFDPIRELLFLACAPFRLLADRDYSLERTPLLTGLLFIVPWLLVRRFRPMLPWALWLCGSLGALGALDAARSTIHVLLPRYLAIASPAVPLLFAGVPWAAGRKKLAYATGIVVFFTGGIYLYSRNPISLECAEYGDINKGLEPVIEPGEAVLAYAPHDSNLSYLADVWTLQLSHSKTLFPRPFIALDRPITPETLRALGTRRMWLVCFKSQSPTEVVPGATVLGTARTAFQAASYHLEVPESAIAPTTESATVPATGNAGPSR